MSYFIVYFFFMAHVLVGLVLLVILLFKLIKDIPDEEKYSKLNFTVIYWSYLTMVWAFVFPILFLVLVRILWLIRIKQKLVTQNT